MYVHHSKEDKLGTGRSLPTSFPLARSRKARSIKLVATFSGFCGLLLVICLLTSTYSRYARHRSEEPRSTKIPESITSQTRPIVVLPATRSNPDFCRTLFSLLINGYDPPVIINWKDNSKTGHYKKIGGMLAWLQERAGSPTDVILMLDGYDVWAQLPGEVVYEQHRVYPFQSSSGVIAGAEKDCWPASPERCSSQPDSPLPTDVYGNRTDKINAKIPLDIKPATSKHTNYRYGRLETKRPRYINSGTVMGTSSDLKQLFLKMSAKLKLLQNNELNVKVKGSDQEMMVVTFSYKDLILQTLSESISDTVNYQIKVLTDLVNKHTQWSNRSIAYNHISHTVPAFLHFPGYKKRMKTDVWWKLMWWMQPTFDTVAPSKQDAHEHSIGRIPAEIFYDKMSLNTVEESGYGARLPDGTWLSYMDMCGSYESAILG